MSAFKKGAMRLLRQGYSPVPILIGSKRPLLEGWHALRAKPMSELEIARLARHSPQLGLGVAGGYGGHVPIDVDTNDPAIVEIVTSVLPGPLVGKHGKRGFTAFYRSVVPIKARKFKTAKPKEEMLVEILTTGQTLIPPTVHPETRRPYRWLTARTLFDPPIDDLPEVSPETIVALADALEPWLPRRQTYEPHGDEEERTEDVGLRMQQYARGALRRQAQDLAAMPKDSGRNRALFDAGATLGKFHHHGLLTLAEIERALLGACETNGLIAEDGLWQCKASLAGGLKCAANDHLPVLGVKQRRA